MKIYIDGKYYDERDAKISVFDHGLLYGDGIFEGIRAYNGRVFKLKEHIDRLFCSAKAILLTIPISHREMIKAVVETCRQNKIRDGYIRLVVTRGVGTLGLNPNRCKKPSVIIIAGKIQLYPREYYAARHGNRHRADGAQSAQRAEPGDQVAELPEQHSGQDRSEQCRLRGSHHAERRRFRGRMHRRQYFHRERRQAVHAAAFGRSALRHHAAGGDGTCTSRRVSPVSEPNLTRYDLFNADECFLTGTGAEIVPVVKIDGRVIGTGKPGPVHAASLWQQYHALTKVSGEPIYE